MESIGRGRNVHLTQSSPGQLFELMMKAKAKKVSRCKELPGIAKGKKAIRATRLLALIRVESAEMAVKYRGERVQILHDLSFAFNTPSLVICSGLDTFDLVGQQID